MNIDAFYPLPGFQTFKIEKQEQKRICLHAKSTSTFAICPYCQTKSHRTHSSYIRKPQTLSCSTYNVQLILQVQRYFCDQSHCSHKTFVERIPEIAGFYARRTPQLNRLLEHISFEMSGEATARVCEKLNIKLSPDSVLRLIRNTQIAQSGPVRILGVDDWAKKKGQNYGTILVDLESHQTIDLLPDRTQTTLSEWLKQHPEIQIVSRDRSFEYKAGIESGAPQATQIVDRWHLLHNLREKLQEVLPGLLKKKEKSTKKKETPTYQKRKEYFELVNYLHALGYSQRAIARNLEISRSTVARYIQLSEVPDYHPRRKTPSQLDVYEDFIRQRLKEGEKDVTRLWKELQQKAYTGQRRSVKRYLKILNSKPGTLSTNKLTWLFMKDENLLLEEELSNIYSLFVGNPKLKEIYQLVQTFQKMLTNREPESLDVWLEKTETCGVKKLQNFAFGLRRDYAAVKAALLYDWSNGQVEGQVNRLKTIKRQMYGRANFDLLRQRVLGPP